MSIAEVDPDAGLHELSHQGLDLDVILDPEEFCNGFRRDQGNPTAEHFPAEDYELNDLLDQFRFATCPLHVTPEYPKVPEGVWKRDVHRATAMLDHVAATTESKLSTRSRAVAPVWKAAPHARWWYEHREVPIPPTGRVACSCDGCTDIYDPTVDE
jgi:hypothetical protein